MQQYNFLPNPLAKLFDKLITKSDKETEESFKKNSVATSEEEFINKQQNRVLFSDGGDFFRNYISFEQIFATKNDKIKKMREMADFPEIMESLETICDESIVEDSNGKIVNFKIIDPKNFNKTKAEEIRKIADKVLNDLFKLNKRGKLLFKKYLVEGEVFLEKILSEDKKSIAGLKMIPPYAICPIYERSAIRGYAHITLDKEANQIEKDIDLRPSQVSYLHWDDYINGDILNPKSYLYYAIRTYNQLKNLEDSLIVYRLTRSIEKRVFNVEIGQMPSGKAREHMQKLINTYRKNAMYDPATGQINQTKNLMSFNEDFWFEKRNGVGTTVENLESGMNLGELKDVDYFLKKMYKVLKMPKSRWSDDKSMFGSGKNGEITREEIKFSSFIKGLQGRFSSLFDDVFLTELKLRGIDEKYIDPKLYQWNFTEANFFSEYKEMELLESRLQILNSLYSLMKNTYNPAGIFSPEFVLKNYFKMSDEDYEKNKELVDKIQVDQGMGGGGFPGQQGGFGGEGGGDPFGNQEPENEDGQNTGFKFTSIENEKNNKKLEKEKGNEV